MATKKNATEETPTVIQIKPLATKVVLFNITGTAPYVQNKFSNKGKEAMASRMKEGGASRGKRVRDARDFEADVEAASYYSMDGWRGIPASAFRNAMISACRTVGYKMTVAKLTVFIEADGFGPEGEPLVRIYGEPSGDVRPARNDNGSVDLRARPMWSPGWTARVRVKFDTAQLTEADVANLMHRAGALVGVGEGRPDSKKSAGLGWGTFEIEGVS